MSYKSFEVDERLNSRLKRLWAINKRIAEDEEVSDEELIYFNDNLSVIQTYYTSAASYWNQIEPLIR